MGRSGNLPPDSSTSFISSVGVSMGIYPHNAKQLCTWRTMDSRHDASLGRMSLNPRGVSCLIIFPFHRTGVAPDPCDRVLYYSRVM